MTESHNLKNESPLDKKPKEVSPSNIVYSNFKIVPKYAPFLFDSFKELTWDCVNKKLVLTVLETPELDAYKWFGEINKRMCDSKKTSFLGIEKDNMLLTLFDENKNAVACITFFELSLLEHSCCFIKQDNIKETLSHYITISYVESKMVCVEKDDGDFKRYQTDNNKMVDQEWKLPCE